MTAPTLGTWRRPPLAYVVAELIISPHYGLPSAITAIQQSLRKDYPRTVEGKELAIEPGTAPVSQPLWQMLSADQGRGVQIGSRAISLHATSYSDSPDFLQRWKVVLAAIGEAKLDAFVERAGLRYVDLIVPTEARAPSDYLVSGLHGVAPPEGGVVQNSIWASSFSVGNLAVQARTASPSPIGMILPPNFNAMPLRKPQIMIDAEERISDKQPIGFIDTDCASDVHLVFNEAELNSLYSELHTKVSLIFKSLISKFAKEEWI